MREAGYQCEEATEVVGQQDTFDGLLAFYYLNQLTRVKDFGEANSLIANLGVISDEQFCEWMTSMLGSRQRASSVEESRKQADPSKSSPRRE